ncbi:hypothetical protein LguiA_017732 [Lonicera macranthoides]
MGKQRRASKSTALSLLRVLDNGSDIEIDDNAVPLKVFNPNLSAESCLRRSPRSTTNVYRSSKDTALSHSLTGESSAKRQEKKRRGGSVDGKATCSKKVKVGSRNSNGKILNNKCLRRSPRLISGGVEGKCELLSLPEPPSVIRRQSSSDKLTISKKCLRSRVIPFAVVEAAKSPLLVQNRDKNKKTSTLKNKQLDSGLIEGSNSTKKTLRSRVIPFAVAAVCENAEVESGLVHTSPKSNNLPIMSSEKCLRSRKVQFRRVIEEEAGKEVKRECSSSLSKRRPNLADKWQPPEENSSKEEKMNESLLGNGDLPMLSDVKCLRSRKIEFCRAVIEAEQVETDCSLIEWPLNSEEKQPQEKKSNNKASVSSEKKERKQKKNDVTPFFIGEPVPDDEARERWRWRYELKPFDSVTDTAKLNHVWIMLTTLEQVKRQEQSFKNQGKGRQKDIGRIIEFFKTMDGEDYFRVQWFYRAEDTVMKEAAVIHDKKRIFYSTLMNDNLLDCIVSKVNVIEIAPVASPTTAHRCCQPPTAGALEVGGSTWWRPARGSPLERSELSLPSYPDTYCPINTTPLEDFFSCAPYKADLALLDLYSGCGGMSTGLCLGAKLSGVNLVTRWAIDYHKSACDSLKLNHPETQVSILDCYQPGSVPQIFEDHMNYVCAFLQARHTTAEDFLELLKEWEKLCQRYLVDDYERTLKYRSKDRGKQESKVDAHFDVKMPRGEYEVSCLVDICYGDPNESGEEGLKFKENLLEGACVNAVSTYPAILSRNITTGQEHIRDFVISGRKSKILPLPGEVDVICGGPPCQGISGYNRYRSIGSPLNDERNRQIIVFMDIVKFLKPNYVLMENVVDILKFDKASLGRYALSRLVDMKYQARLGTMAAGCYGLPQFRLRVFLWGALPTEKLPQFPLPTHDVVVRYWPPNEFEQNTVAYNEGQPRDLEEAVVLRDAISDLPAGANFRDLPGVIVSADNVALRDPKEEPLLPSGKRLRTVTSLRKNGSPQNFRTIQLEIVQAALHPEQDRVLTLREYARLQGFPDFYRFCGTVKERLSVGLEDWWLDSKDFKLSPKLQVKQLMGEVGNAVAVPVARALGYALGRAVRKLSGAEPLMTLPPKFAFQRAPIDEIFI